jgi:predicted NBD/HSP70 family sugar kinase
MSLPTIQMPGEASSIGQIFISVLTQGPLCRRDVAEITGLSQGSVTKLARPMIDAGYLVETEPISAGPGRPTVPLRIVPGRRFAIGIKVMAHEVVAVLIDMSGTVRAAQRLPVDATDPDSVIDRIAAAAAELPKQVRGARSKVTGIGIGAGGHVDRESGVVRFSPNLHWPEYPLAQKVSERVGYPVLVENDANALALWEQWFGDGRAVDSFAVVTLGAGVGCGLVIGGSLWTGAHGAAGEFGHVAVTTDGPLCECGRRGCLQSLVNDDAIVAASSAAAGRRIRSAEHAHRLALEGSAEIRRVFAEAGTALGRGLATLVNLVDPELIILSGEGIAGSDLMMDSLRAELSERAFSSIARDCRILVRPLPDETWAAGAAAGMLRSGVLRSLDALIDAS